MQWICLTFCHVFSMQKQKKGDGKVKLGEELNRMVQDAHAALTDLRSYDAEQAFRKALDLLETTIPKVVKIGLFRS